MGNDCCCDWSNKPQPRRAGNFTFTDNGRMSHKVANSDLLGSKMTATRVYSQYGKNGKYGRFPKSDRVTGRGVDNLGMTPTQKWGLYTSPPAVHRTRKKPPLNTIHKQQNITKQPQSSRHNQQSRSPDPLKASKISNLDLSYSNNAYVDTEGLVMTVTVSVAEPKKDQRRKSSNKNLDRSYSLATTIAAMDEVAKPALEVTNLSTSNK